MILDITMMISKEPVRSVSIDLASMVICGTNFVIIDQMEVKI